MALTKITGEGVGAVDSLTVNRATSHGDIVEVQKDGTRFGALGSQSSGFYIDGESGHSGLRFANGAVTPREDLADADNSNDLGASNNRWANLYLGGGAFIGGTATANKLDDYEEGTWTATYGSGGSNTGVYTKIGRLVHVHVIINNTSKTITSGEIAGLPFAVDGTLAAGSIGRIIGMGETRETLGLGATSSNLQIHDAGGGANELTTGSGTVRFDLSVTYFTT
tara:strand:+ start:40 stop:711 length:672 start_codon:yes stop_codon:yes gene_type:complete